MGEKNKCGDYVCLYNILNCTNHISDAGNTQPIPGKAYLINGGSSGTTIYLECVVPQNMTPIDGIYSRKEFYQNDYADPLEPAFASTI